MQHIACVLGNRRASNVTCTRNSQHKQVKLKSKRLLTEQARGPVILWPDREIFDIRDWNRDCQNGAESVLVCRFVCFLCLLFFVFCFSPSTSSSSISSCLIQFSSIFFRFLQFLFRVHAKGVVLCDKTCFCLLSTF